MLFFILIISITPIRVKGGNEIEINEFSKHNCKPGIPPVHAIIFSVITKSKLKCAVICSTVNCRSYRYDSVTLVCRLSSAVLDDGTGIWYCSLYKMPLTTSPCSPQYQYYMGYCLKALPRDKESYSQMREGCGLINGSLYRITSSILGISYHTLNVVSTFATTSAISGLYAIQGTFHTLLLKWQNDDESVAVPTVEINLLSPFGNTLAIDSDTGHLNRNGVNIDRISGYICEERR